MVDENGSDWGIELVGLPADLSLAASLLRVNATALMEPLDDDRWVLRSARFAGCAEARSVAKAARPLLDIINGACAATEPAFEGLQPGPLHEFRPDGSKPITVLVGTAVNGRARVSANLTVGEKDTEPSIAHKALFAADEALADALRIYAMFPRTPDCLYKVYEAGTQHPDFRDWSTRVDRDRFKHSMNSRSTLGDAARHWKEDTQPPKNPMSLREAEAFVATIVRQWIDAVWESSQA